MTIIEILLALGLCHFIRELGRFRKREWLTTWVDFGNDAFGKLPLWQDALGFLVIIAVPLLGLLLINHVLTLALGSTGSFLLALVVLIYSFGPRDLDTDVAEIVEAEDDEQRGKAMERVLRRPVPRTPTGPVQRPWRRCSAKHCAVGSVSSSGSPFWVSSALSSTAWWTGW